MDTMLRSVSTIGRKGTVEKVVSHNHPGRIRERGQCPACDELHEFYATPE